MPQLLLLLLLLLLFLTAYIRPLEILLAKKTTELVLLFHKNITDLVFLRLNVGQKSFKVLNHQFLELWENAQITNDIS